MLHNFTTDACTLTIGRYFTALYFSPFLNAGATFACFQSLGISPDFSDFEKMDVKLLQLVHLILLILSHVYCLVVMRCVDLDYIEVLILQLMICLFVAF